MKFLVHSNTPNYKVGTFLLKSCGKIPVDDPSPYFNDGSHLLVMTLNGKYYQVVDNCDLLDYQTYTKYGLNPRLNSDFVLKFITKCVDDGNMNGLKWGIKSGINFCISPTLLTLAMKNKRLDILNFIFSHYIQKRNHMFYTSRAIHTAASMKYIHGLNWIKNHQLGNFKHIAKSVVINALQKKHHRIVSWFVNHKFVSTSDFSMDFASRWGSVSLLNMWLKSGKKLIYSKKALELASRFNHLRVIEWWGRMNRLRGIELKYNILKDSDLALLKSSVPSLVDGKFDNVRISPKGLFFMLLVTLWILKIIPLIFFHNK